MPIRSCSADDVSQPATPRPDGSAPRDSGSVTAETAVVLPVLVGVLVLALWAVDSVVVQLRCVDAARVAVRAAARGEPDALVRSAALRSAPSGAKVVVRRGAAGGSDIVVEVRAVTHLPGPWREAGPGLALTGRAEAESELPPTPRPLDEAGSSGPWPGSR
jgi:hypothetical protein